MKQLVNMKAVLGILIILLNLAAVFWLVMAGFYHEWWETQVADIAKAILALIIAKWITPEDPAPIDPYEDIEF